MKKQIAYVAGAEILGCKAFKAGQKRIPHYDLELGNLLKESCPGTATVESLKRSTKILKAWLDGWDNANLANLKNYMASK